MFRALQRLLILISLVVLCTPLRPVWAKQKTVLIVYSYHEELAWTRQCDRGIRSLMLDTVRLKRVYMDTKRILPSEFQAKTNTALDVFRQVKPDLVMLSDDTALRLLGPTIAATGTPVVYLGVNGNPRRYFSTLPDNVVGIIERIPLFHWIRYLLDIVPDAETVMVLMDDSPTAQAILATSFGSRKSILFNGKTIYWETAKGWERWKYLVQNTKAGIVVMPVYHALRDGDGSNIPYTNVIAWTSVHCGVPLFATQDYAVGDQGVVGSFVLTGETHGRTAAMLALQILDGEQVRHLPIPEGQKGVFYFNKKQLKRFELELPQSLRRSARFK